jgi:hypothetical protein
MFSGATTMTTVLLALENVGRWAAVVACLPVSLLRRCVASHSVLAS